MDRITVKVPAKVNLMLDVTEKRSDGYHNIESIFQSVGIYDVITVTKLYVPEIVISCNRPDVPCGKTNIAYKAAQIFFESTGISGGAAISIEKRIPSQAGLGGGSADGAGVLYALNKIYETDLDGRKLTELGGKVSADTAFFTVGGTAYVSGIGDDIQSIRFIPKLDLVIAKGSSGISTPEAYKKIDSLKNPKHPDTQKMLKYIDKGKFLKHCDLCENIFESVTDSEDVSHIKRFMYDCGALSSIMSGSGSAVFGIFDNNDEAQKCAENLKSKYPFAVYCRTTQYGVTIV